MAMHAGNLGMIHTQKGKGERHTCRAHEHATAAWDDWTTTSRVCGQECDGANNRNGKALATCVFAESVFDSPLVTTRSAAVPQPPALSQEAAAAGVDVATVTASSNQERFRLQRKLPKRRLVAGCCCWLARC